jgi:hypothetical protein
MASEAEFAEALPTLSGMLSFLPSFYIHLMFRLLMQILDVHFCYQEFSAEQSTSNLPPCTNLNAYPND